MIILRTIHGSRLYGTNTAGSDYDWYEVVEDGQRASQEVSGDDDTIRVGLSRFMHLCGAGSHQALEAMFSPVAEVDEMPHLRQAYRAGEATVHDKYLRTIKSFSLMGRYADRPAKLMKRRRNAVRMTLCLDDLSTHGRFNPVLTDSQLDFIDSIMDTRDTFYGYIGQYVDLQGEDTFAHYYTKEELDATHI